MSKRSFVDFGKWNPEKDDWFSTFSKSHAELREFERKMLEEEEDRMRGRYTLSYLRDNLGIKLIEIYPGWYKCDPHVFSYGNADSMIPLLHKCNKQQNYFSKVEASAAGSLVWCNFCEEHAPEEAVFGVELEKHFE